MNILTIGQRLALVYYPTGAGNRIIKALPYSDATKPCRVFNKTTCAPRLKGKIVSLNNTHCVTKTNLLTPQHIKEIWARAL